MNFGEHLIPKEHIIIQTEYTFIFTNIRPFLPYHILVSPIRICQHLADLDIKELNDLFKCVQMASKALKPFGNDFTISLQDGPAAGQTVNHVHIHVIPRNMNDIENNDLVYAKGALDYSRRTRTFEEMAKEANFLRTILEKTFEEYNFGFMSSK